MTPPASSSNPGTGERVLLGLRVPRPIVAFMKKAAQDRGLDLTAYTNKVFEGLRTYFGLPTIAIERLDEDRRALKLDHLDYFLHAFYRRSEEVKAHGPGFDSHAAEVKAPKPKR